MDYRLLLLSLLDVLQFNAMNKSQDYALYREHKTKTKQKKTHKTKPATTNNNNKNYEYTTNDQKRNRNNFFSHSNVCRSLMLFFSCSLHYIYIHIQQHQIGCLLPKHMNSNTSSYDKHIIITTIRTQQYGNIV